MRFENQLPTQNLASQWSHTTLFGKLSNALLHLGFRMLPDGQSPTGRQQQGWREKFFHKMTNQDGMNFVKGEGVPIVLLQQPSPSCRYQAPATEKTDFSKKIIFDLSILLPFPSFSSSVKHPATTFSLVFVFGTMQQRCKRAQTCFGITYLNRTGTSLESPLQS